MKKGVNKKGEAGGAAVHSFTGAVAGVLIGGIIYEVSGATSFNIIMITTVVGAIAGAIIGAFKKEY